MNNLYLVAYLSNADDECEPTLAIATCNTAEEWHTTEDSRIWPYWTERLETSAPSPPEGWADHLAAEAQAYAAKQRDSRRPTGLAALLAAKPKPTITTTPITRRGF